jgi:hypothetical protein
VVAVVEAKGDGAVQGTELLKLKEETYEFARRQNIGAKLERLKFPNRNRECRLG